MKAPKTLTFSFRLTAEDLAAIEKGAEAEDMSVSQFVRKAAKDRAKKVIKW